MKIGVSASINTPGLAGLGFDYLFQGETQAPSGIVGQLLVGMKL